MKAIRPDINYDRSEDKKLTASGKIYSLILVLDTGGSSEEKCDALTRLCPCRNRIYDREAWQRIFRQVRTTTGKFDRRQSTPSTRSYN